MKNSLQLDQSLLMAAKEIAAQTGRTLTAIGEDTLRSLIEGRKKPLGEQPSHTSLSYGGSGHCRGVVDLGDSAALRDLLDTRWPCAACPVRGWRRRF